KPAAKQRQNKPQQTPKKQKQQTQTQSQPVYNKRQKSRRHRKIRPYSEPDAADVGWSPAPAPSGGDLAPGAGEDRFLPRSLREIMWLKRVAALSPKDRRRYLKSRRRTNPEVGDVAGMRRAPAKLADLRRRPGESQPRHLARVERTAQQTLLSAQYADRFGERQNKQQQEQKQKNKKKIVAEAAAAGDRQSEQEQKKANQKPRRTAGTRPSRLEPVVSEPPKSLARLKLPIINKKNKTGNASLTMKATIAGDVSAQGGGGFPLDRMLIT
ncbi:hypothetical protein BOX15_Mlig018035g1, partial [Macrostomum lignano]